MDVMIGGVNYDFLWGFREDAAARASFDRLARKTFGLSFESWYRSGGWGEQYLPHTLFEGGTAAANVSVNLIPVILRGKRRLFVQLGTVMTAEEYRGRGLARFLMEQVLARYAGRCGCLYLFANDSVLDFYPKFGFVKREETGWRMPLAPAARALRARRLDMARPGHRALLLSAYRRGNPFSALQTAENPGLLLFYAAQFLRDSVYYLDEAGAAVIAEQNGGELLCYDVFGGKGFPLPALLAAVAGPGTLRAQLGFAPGQVAGAESYPLREKDTTLFVLAGQEDPFGGEALRFLLLSRA